MFRMGWDGTGWNVYFRGHILFSFLCLVCRCVCVWFFSRTMGSTKKWKKLEMNGIKDELPFPLHPPPPPPPLLRPPQKIFKQNRGKMGRRFFSFAKLGDWHFYRVQKRLKGGIA